MYRILILLLALLPAMLPTGCRLFHRDPDLALPENAVEEIDRVVTTLYENGQFQGTVLVSVRGEVIYQGAFGYADISDSLPNTIDTKFRIASFTKPFTALLILQLVEDGIIGLEGKLTEYLPEFTPEGGDQITIHQLLTHTAGIIGHPRIPDLDDIEKRHYTRKELLDLIMKYDLIYEPGEGREYSNFGYALLALVLERVTGRSYDELLIDRICSPAGMSGTLSDVTEEPIEGRAVGYTHDYFLGPVEAPYLDMSFVLGAGQLLSTVGDLYLFDRALYTDRLLSDAGKELFFTMYGWFPMRYPFGTGWKTVLCNNLDGSINGFQSHTQRIAKDSVLIVAMRNIKEAVYENQIVIKWPDAIASPVLAILYGEEYELSKISGAFTVFSALVRSGRSEAGRIHDEILRSGQGRYYLDDDEIEFFLEELENRGRDEEAAAYRAIFRLPAKDS